jgi:anti-anti-sigma factor
MEEAQITMSDPPRNMSQAEVDELLQQFAHTGEKMAVVGDSRYTMKLEARGGVLWLTISGMVMQPAPVEFSDRLQQLIDAGTMPTALVDLRRCTYLCSSGLGVLAQLLNRGGTVGGKVVLLGASEKLHRLIELIGLGEHFIHLDREEEAARYLLLQPRHHP